LRIHFIHIVATAAGGPRFAVLEQQVENAKL
jgi:hypothetical protein